MKYLTSCGGHPQPRANLCFNITSEVETKVGDQPCGWQSFDVSSAFIQAAQTCGYDHDAGQKAG